MHKVWLDIFFLLFLFYNNVYCGNVLILPPMISASHKIPLRVWAELLARRGHTIYWWSPTAKSDNYQPKQDPNIHVDHYHVDVDDQVLMNAFRHGNASFIHDAWWTSRYAVPYLETSTALDVTPFCESVILNHKESFQNVINRKYDLIILDEILNPCGWLVAQLAEGPVATFVSTSAQTRGSMTFNAVPIPSAYFPSMGDLFVPSDRMSLVERIRNTVNWLIGHAGDYFLYPVISEKLKKHLPRIESIESSMVRPHVQFLAVPKFFDFVTPSVRNSINTAGLQIPKDVKPLDERYRNIVNSASHGFILMSFGHWGNWNVAPERVRLSFVEAFKRVPSKFTIIWQYNGPVVENLPNNIHLSKWVPLNSLLAEPSCKLFITHCGCNSLSEATHHGVPIVAVPLSADQPDGAAKSISKGFGVLLKKNLITPQSAFDSIMKVLTNDSYSNNVKKFSKFQKALPLNAEETVSFWSEFVMRHHQKKNGSFYRTSKSALQLSFLQYNCLDIILTFIFVCGLILYMFTKLCKFAKYSVRG